MKQKVKRILPYPTLDFFRGILGGVWGMLGFLRVSHYFHLSIISKLSGFLVVRYFLFQILPIRLA